MTRPNLGSTLRSHLPLILVAGGVFFLAGLVLVAALLGSAPAQSTDAIRGKAVYDASCAGCHGSRGQGYGVPAAPPLDASGTAWRLPPEALRNLIRSGTHEGMPAFGQRLNDGEVESVLNYIQSWWTTEQQDAWTAAPEGG